jgi:hypothetical protein
VQTFSGRHHNVKKTALWRCPRRSSPSSSSSLAGAICTALPPTQQATRARALSFGAPRNPALQGFHQIDDLGRFGDPTWRCRRSFVRLDKLAQRVLIAVSEARRLKGTRSAFDNRLGDHDYVGVDFALRLGTELGGGGLRRQSAGSTSPPSWVGLGLQERRALRHTDRLISREGPRVRISFPPAPSPYKRHCARPTAPTSPDP